jgi:lipopolysaccharide transport protein LptA
MAPSFPDRRRRGFLALLAGLGALSCRLPGFAADVGNEAVQYTGHNLRLHVNEGSFQLDDVQLRQPPDTLITAASGEASGLAASDNADNSRWTLMGMVHIEHEGTVLDADSAVVVFANRRILSIEVLGSPARFSRPTKTPGQRFMGTSESIAYDGQKRQVRFSGHPWYSFGAYEGTADTPLVYDLDSGLLSSEESGNSQQGVHGTFHPERRVPPPRTPDRSNAQ